MKLTKKQKIALASIGIGVAVLAGGGLIYYYLNRHGRRPRAGGDYYATTPEYQRSVGSDSGSDLGLEEGWIFGKRARRRSRKQRRKRRYSRR